MDISGLYWRRNALNGSQCPPGLLALDKGRLSFRTADSRVFDEPAGAVTAKVTGWDSLLLTVGGTRYALMTSAGQMAPKFSKAQQQAIDAAKRAGTLRSLSDWATVLRESGASVSAAPFSYRRVLLGAILVIVVGGAITAIVLNGGL